ncbi:hypothetical protein J1P26_07855 [Neobacillus sp. MM2021_6]|uniref:hypothetical protein n=1 Tax=Bacillaceae TaxID=186817 RepID=UPI00140A1C2F|nr:MULTISPECIES: hypothetical protein [Bacillaceae]MBO0959634.1 hypothetical protein [Neobacillus sp. MM2021_6]NHC19743.1 hypothetical protein [Bacillus sp. MM2020_4]
MYPYGNYQVPQTQFEYYPYVQQDQYSPDRQLSQISQLFQLPQWRQFERRLDLLEREYNQLNRRLNRVNQRLRAVENRLHIPFNQFDGDF